MNRPVSRRRFLGGASAASLAFRPTGGRAAGGALAVLGGTPVRKAPFPSWPKIGAVEEQALLEVLESGQWFRGTSGRFAAQFETDYAKLMGVQHCLATANGTSALLASLAALGVGPGDEVIVPPYTFVATVNVVLMRHALPVFVDTDIETFQMDARKIEAALSERTRALIPVYLGGAAPDMDAILAIAGKRGIPVVEDACQAHLGEWRGKKAGSLGKAGCFSFQGSKNLNSGEGGAIITNDSALFERCYAFHNNGRGRRTGGYDFSYRTYGANFRMTQFQAALLVAQMTRLEEQTKTRERNAAYLTSLLREIPGILPARVYDGCTRNAYHLYMFRYDARQFEGVPRRTFLKALQAEGIPASGGYSPLNKEPFLKNALGSREYQAIYPKGILAKWEVRCRCPENDRLCQEAVWLTQNMLLGTRADMEQIAEAVRKIQSRAGELKRFAGIRRLPPKIGTKVFGADRS